MKILGIFHAYVPKNNSGAEHTLHAINKWLVKEGVQVDVWCDRLESYKLDGVNIIGGKDRPNFAEYDLLFTHLNYSGLAVNVAREYKKNIVYFTHNDFRNGVVAIRRKGIYVVHNAKWGMYNQDIEHFPSIIVNPPTFLEDYTIKGRRKQEYITLVNMSEPKGGKIIAEIAKRMPKQKFLGVIGAYGDQQIADVPDNLEIMETQNDIKKVLRNTKILLMPSRYESWGKVGVEAMVSGIPVIANPTEGLKESLDYAGLFVERENISAWVSTIESLSDSDAYNKRSELCKLRAKELSPEPQLQKLREFLNDILNDKWKHNL